MFFSHRLSACYPIRILHWTVCLKLATDFIFFYFSSSRYVRWWSCECFIGSRSFHVHCLFASRINAREWGLFKHKSFSSLWSHLYHSNYWDCLGQGWGFGSSLFYIRKITIPIAFWSAYVTQFSYMFPRLHCNSLFDASTWRKHIKEL